MSSRLCPFCMRMSEEETCPHCGKNTNYAGSPGHLPAGYVVSGKHPYVLGAALGQGGFGITYIALDMVTGERVAIKEYYPSYCSTRTDASKITAYSNQEEVYEKGRDRFLDEARTLKSLSDLKNIVNVQDFFEANNSAYLVMEFLDGSSLKEYAAQHGKFPARKFLEQIAPLMEDLERMHQRGVVHRDIAPDNIILLPDGQMKLIDFGAARSYVGDKSMTVVVKKGFAPVEQYLSKGTTASTDVYALAATIYYCITGTVPMEAPERQYDNVPLRTPSSFGADLTPGQEKALEEAMKIQQKERTQSVQEFLDALRAKEPAKQKRAPSKPAEKKGKKKFPALLAVAAAGLVLLGGFFLLPDKDSRDSASQPSLKVTEPAAQQATPEQTEAVLQVNPADRITENVSLSIMAAQYTNRTANWWRNFEMDFEKEYRNVDLVVDVVSWNDIYTAINTRIANGAQPDILNIDSYEEYQGDDLLLPVQTYLSEDTYQKFYPQFLELSKTDGDIWAVPDLTSVRAFFYNRQIFEELGLKAPETWADIEDACEAIRRRYPQMYPIGLDMTTDDGHSTFACFALSNGGGFVDSNGDWNLNCTENVETLQFLNGLVKSRFASPDSVSQTRWDLQDLFVDGKIAMMVAPDSLLDFCKSQNSSVEPGVVPIPTKDGKKSSTLAVMDRFMCFDNQQSDAELAAITCFFDFLYEDERYAAWISEEGYLPATSSGNAYLASMDSEKAVWDEILTSATFLPAAKSDWMEAKMGTIDVLQRVLLGADPRTLLNKLQQELTK